MEQIGMEILNGLKAIATHTQVLKILHIAWIIALVGYGWRTLCHCVKAVISIVRYAKDKDSSVYDDDDDEDDFC